MSESIGKKLIEELLANPKLFNKSHKGYDLLQEYFKGLPLETLIPLLKTSDKSIQGPALWIVSELGNEGCSLLPYVLPFVSSEERFLKYYALECIIVCSKGNHIKEFIHIIKAMNSEDEVIRVLAMYLISNADDIQLQEGIKLVEGLSNNTAHSRGLSALRECASLDSQEIRNMIDSDSPLIRKYGVIAAKKVYQENSNLINYASTSLDPDVQKFLQKMAQ